MSQVPIYDQNETAWQEDSLDAAKNELANTAWWALRTRSRLREEIARLEESLAPRRAELAARSLPAPSATDGER